MGQFLYKWSELLASSVDSYYLLALTFCERDVGEGRDLDVPTADGGSLQKVNRLQFDLWGGLCVRF